jgi:hypothetical protein
MTMNHRSDFRSTLIDLGSARRKTKGSTGFHKDEVLKQDTPGLSAD